jgi:hypothetical protein
VTVVVCFQVKHNRAKILHEIELTCFLIQKNISINTKIRTILRLDHNFASQKAVEWQKVLKKQGGYNISKASERFWPHYEN